MGEIVGSVSALWQFPVKSMKGKSLDQAEFTAHGLVGDRAYALIDSDTGKLVTGQNPKLFPGLLGCQAVFSRAATSGSRTAICANHAARRHDGNQRFE